VMVIFLGKNAAEIDRIQHKWRAREVLATVQTRLQDSYMDANHFGDLTRRAFAYEKKPDASVQIRA